MKEKERERERCRGRSPSLSGYYTVLYLFDIPSGILDELHLHIPASPREDGPPTCASTRRTDRGTGQLAVLPPQQQSTPGCWPPIIAFGVYGGGNIAAKRNKIGRAVRGCKKSAVTDFSSRFIGLSSRVMFRARRRITAIDLSPFALVLKCLMSPTSPSSSSSSFPPPRQNIFRRRDPLNLLSIIYLPFS